MTPDLYNALEHAWTVISDRYDISTRLPDMETLFRDMDRCVPTVASKVVLANMLGEAMECVGRFSPWYKQPAQAFGLILKSDHTGGKLWALSDETLEMYRPLLDTISAALDVAER